MNFCVFLSQNKSGGGGRNRDISMNLNKLLTDEEYKLLEEAIKHEEETENLLRSIE